MDAGLAIDIAHSPRRYQPVRHLAARFSRNASIPSTASWSSEVPRHRLGRAVVRRTQRPVDLRVERALAERDHRRAARNDPIGERLHGPVEASIGTTRLTSPQSSAVAASIVSPVSSISITRLRATLRTTPTAGVEQKTPTLIARQREARRIDGDGEVAHRHELAAGRRRDAVHARDHRLRQLRELDHRAAAAVEELALPRFVGVTAQLASRSCPAQKPLPSPAMTTARTSIARRDLIERAFERVEHRPRQRVVALAAVQRQRADAVARIGQHEGDDARLDGSVHGDWRI